jgi:hypothetical protein
MILFAYFFNDDFDTNMFLLCFRECIYISN